MRIFLMLLIILASVSLTNARSVGVQDSIGLERIGDKVYILHQVEEKETLYSLSRRYNVAIKAIIGVNPSAEFGLNIGEILKIPSAVEKVPAEDGRIVHIVKPQETLYSISRSYGVSSEDVKKWNRISTNILDIGQELIIYPSDTDNTTSDSSSKVIAVTPSQNGEYIYHVVKAGETLYSISRTLEVPLEQLREWNDLSVNDISIGQQLIVGKKVPKEEPATDPVKETEVIYADTGTPLSRENANFEEVEENGLAELIEGSSNNRKYLALHRTAKVGTIMRVRNEMNGQEVFVRVIGKLPDSGANRNILIKISRSAYDQLGAIDARFRVTISFIP
ncbi:LysM peptidoglycan-binding domain-containing protein [Fulvivirga sedimenti]|uniref:LysM peptidoglycan-binding domain-containing protein n=1 Tax=Fulvivirga sedimenti TaxID=2879465 RepID=A0A9X1HN72_9BACT|nr:LysM peptidoglycan-binding domain-containing protein [Fulvivirga sedimenti]MCA6073898.1 LysM peptidoglycan-binding domain-containing protein [Fulvivirga sedimenti]